MWWACWGGGGSGAGACSGRPWQVGIWPPHEALLLARALQVGEGIDEAVAEELASLQAELLQLSVWSREAEGVVKQEFKASGAGRGGGAASF